MKRPVVIANNSNDKTILTTMSELKARLDEIKKMNVLLAMHDAGKLIHRLDRQHDVQYVLTCYIRDEEGDIINVMSYEHYNFKKIMKQAKLHLKDIEIGLAARD